MIKQGRKQGTVRFTYRPSNGAKRVALAGDFNGWQPTRMKRQKGGAFAATVPLHPGTHEYRFVVDGEWVPDPDHEQHVPNPYGSVNSLAEVT